MYSGATSEYPATWPQGIIILLEIIPRPEGLDLSLGLPGGGGGGETRKMGVSK